MLAITTHPRIVSAMSAIDTEARGLAQLKAALMGKLERPFLDAAETIERVCKGGGHIIVSGIGKSGIIGRKIASTLASTGTPALFVHASEASHGDLGMITERDGLIVLSNSGETPELANLVAYAKRWRVPLIAITGVEASTLARAADIVLALPPHEEACPHGLAPTTSTTMQAALGDALAITLLTDRGFGPQDFRALHPGGKLGAQLCFVGEIMHGVEELPLIGMDAVMADALVEMTSKRFGCVGIISETGELVGVITDGDLRRHMAADLVSRTTASVMTRNLITIEPRTLASTALAILNERKITSLFVLEGACPIGIVHVHDLLRVGVK